MSKKRLYKNLLTNLESNEVFYKFYHAITDEEKVSFKGTDPCLLYGAGIPVFTGRGLPTLIYDIAYERDGKLYQILTNQEVVVIHEGVNIREKNQLFAATNISKASSDELRSFVSIMTQQRSKNIKGYEYSYKKNRC